MKFACSTNLFLRYSVEESIQMIKDLGYEGVEILCDIPHAYPADLDDRKINSIKKTISDSNMTISNLNAYFCFI
jgi:sugar phosphate isomerase/epimerase